MKAVQARPAQKSQISGVPRCIYSYQYLPGKKTYLVTLTLKNTPGALSDVLRRLASNGINVNFVAGFSFPGKGAGGATIFGEAAGKPASRKTVEEALAASTSVLEAKVETSAGGILVEKDLFPLVFSDQTRALLVSQDVLSETLSGVRKTFGEGGGDVIVYEQGRSAGKANAKRTIELFGKEKTLGNWAVLLNQLASQGLAKPIFASRSADPPSAKIRLENSFECAAQKSSKPYSQFMRGFFAGGAEAFFEVKAHCQETKCIAQGDPFCEFGITFG